MEETKTTTLSVPPGSSSNGKGSDKESTTSHDWGAWKSPPNIFNNRKDVSNLQPALGAPPGLSRSGQDLVSLTVATQQMNTLLKNRYGAQYIYTALEVLFSAKDSKSLHFGEYPAKVHWHQVPDPVSNPCCRRVADVIRKKYALLDVLPIRSKGLSGDISFKNLTQELLKDGKYVQALKIYFKCSIKYFSAATVFPIWGQANIGVELLPMAHPSGHGQRSNPTHLAKVQHDLQTVLAHIISPHDIQGYLRILASDEAIRFEAHVKELELLGMRPPLFTASCHPALGGAGMDQKDRARLLLEEVKCEK